MKELIISDCINFLRQQIKVEKLPSRGTTSMQSYTCPIIGCVVGVDLATDKKGKTKAFCLSRSTCGIMQSPRQ